MIEKILLLPAFEGIAQPAMRRTSELALAAGARVEVFKAVYEPHLEGYLGDPSVYASLRGRLVEEHRERLEVLVSALRDRGLEADAKAVWGSPAHELAARETLAGAFDLLITSPSEPSGGLSHADWRLITSCPAPLLIVNSDAIARYKRIVAAVDPYQEHGKPPELDLAILEQAQALTKTTRAELTVIHCFTPLADFIAAGLEQMPVEEVEQALEAARRDALAALLHRAGQAAGSGELVSGKPEDVLLARAEQDRADLLVLGSVSRGRLEAFFIGSTAERVLRRTKADVLVVKPPGFPANADLGTE